MKQCLKVQKYGLDPKNPVSVIFFTKIINKKNIALIY